MEIHEGEALSLKTGFDYDLISVSNTSPLKYSVIDHKIHVASRDGEALNGHLQIGYIKECKRRLTDGIFTYREFMNTDVNVTDTKRVLQSEYIIKPSIISMSYAYDGFLLKIAIDMDRAFLGKFGNLQACVENTYFEILEDFLDGNTWKLSISLSSDKPFIDLAIRDKDMLIRRTLKVENL